MVSLVVCPPRPLLERPRRAAHSTSHPTSAAVQEAAEPVPVRNATGKPSANPVPVPDPNPNPDPDPNPEYDSKSTPQVFIRQAFNVTGSATGLYQPKRHIVDVRERMPAKCVLMGNAAVEAFIDRWRRDKADGGLFGGRRDAAGAWVPAATDDATDTPEGLGLDMSDMSLYQLSTEVNIQCEHTPNPNPNPNPNPDPNPNPNPNPNLEKVLNVFMASPVAGIWQGCFRIQGSPDCRAVLAGAFMRAPNPDPDTDPDPDPKPDPDTDPDPNPDPGPDPDPNPNPNLNPNPHRSGMSCQCRAPTAVPNCIEERPVPQTLSTRTARIRVRLVLNSTRIRTLILTLTLNVINVYIYPNLTLTLTKHNPSPILVTSWPLLVGTCYMGPRVAPLCP